MIALVVWCFGMMGNSPGCASRPCTWTSSVGISYDSAARAEAHHQEPQRHAAAPPHPAAEKLQVIRATTMQHGYDDDEGDDDDEDDRFPDLEKDDMHARRTGMFQKSTGGSAASFNLFLPVPGSVKFKATPTSGSSTPIRPVEQEKVPAYQSSSSLSRSAELYRAPMATAAVAAPAAMTNPGARTPRDSPDMARKSGLRTGDREEAGRGRSTDAPAPKHATSGPTHFLPCANKVGKEGEEPRRRPSWLDDDLPPIFSSKAASAADESESVSMIDMRGEEEAILQPHSQTRHELMHNQYNKHREEEDQWQDDLARWKNRRRSASQDLIKKEEERKMMEKLMTGNGSASSRRKSIKTYKEIVEDKERREQELHEAYRNARTPEEAAAILQRYALRFTISDAILERLQLPKLPDAVSTGAAPSTGPGTTPTPDPAPSAGPVPTPTRASAPSSGPRTTPIPKPTPYTGPGNTPTHDPTSSAGPITTPKQEPTPSTIPGASATPDPAPCASPHAQPLDPGPTKSAPKTKFTTTVDSTVKEVPETRTKPLPQPRSMELSPTRTPTSKPVPLLSPKPYIQPRNSQTGLQSLKADGMVRVNGETGEQFGRTDGSAEGRASPVRFTALRSPARAPAPARTHTQPTPLQREETAREETDSKQRREQEETAAPSPWKEDKLLEAQTGSGAGAMNTERKITTVATVILTDTHSQPTTDLSSMTQLSGSLGLEARRDGLAPGHPAESTQPPQPHANTPVSLLASENMEKDSIPITAPVLNLAKRLDHWSWDPEEERKRQEIWQQEQERLLQEKYQQEQEKLKKEWERAQKEVEEEERKYHEEEKRILEETVAPLTPRSSALPSPIRADAPIPPNPQDTIVRSLADWERKQEQLERQTRGEEEKLSQDGSRHDSAMEPNTNGAVLKNHSIRGADSLPFQSPGQKAASTAAPKSDQRPPPERAVSPLRPPMEQGPPPALSPSQDSIWSSKQPQSQQEQQEEVCKKSSSLERNWNSQQTQPGGVKRSGSYENVETNSSMPPPACTPSTQPQSPNRSVSGKKLCSSCANPLGKGAAMIIESLSLYFHIQCFKCGVCKGQLGDTSTGTDVRIRNGLLNCHQCYIRSRAAGQPTTL
ncbi:hypothetical protein AGOR_G00188760 [Albula goreensis]|uniref:LIM zinc-binding domain-containing protein n=1 Tax=Albula goreensis TaxID=1534307 RepID=A0A8T3CQC0_9TELE|nr:hypothetical protein AGOR_G00188760 [Albula goreensis]